MNISNLYQNQIFKNYVELCTALEIPIKGGKSKELQIEDLSRYFRYEKDKHKFVITEIFENPIPKIDDGNGNNSKYVEHVKYLLLIKLASSYGYKCTFTKNKLFEFLGMVNPTYLNKKLINNIITSQDRIKPFDINHFYLRVNDKLSRILSDSLNSLKKQYLIDYREVDIICTTNLRGKKEYKEATKEELKILLDVRQKILLDMGLNSMSQVIFKFKTKEFYEKVNDMLKDKYNINYSYKQFEFIFTKGNILYELSLLEEKKHKQELNNKVIDVVNLNAENTYNKNIEEYINNLELFSLNTFHYSEENI